MREEAEEICHVPEKVLDFRDEVIRQREEEDSLSRLLSTRPPYARLWDVISIMLLISSAILMILEPQALFLWLVVGILLYSYNFIIILLPTTRKKLRPEERDILKKMNKNEIWLAVRLLLKKRYLAIELGITLFLGGMVPLSLSFAIIMGMGLLMTVYFALVNDLTWSFAFLVVFQLVFILGFYLFVVLLAPHDQGITRLARSFKQRIDKAREGATRSVIGVYLTMLALVIIAIVLVIGAMLLPGLTLVTIMVEIENWGWGVIAMFLFIFVTQLIVMRHFQSIASRRMVITLLRERVKRFNQEVLDPLEIWTDGGLCHDRAGFKVAFKTLKKNYYSLAIYDVIRVDIFASSPVYLVGPRLRYLLDERVLDNF
jgi:hypothetical protein